MAKRTNALEKFDAAQLAKELQRRQAIGDKLLVKRSKLLASIGEIEKELVVSGVAFESIAPSGKKLGRKPNKGKAAKDGSEKEKVVQHREGGTLADALMKVMSATKGQDVITIATNVLEKTEYATSQRDPDKLKPMVTQAITKNPDCFQRVERGKYVKVVTSSKESNKTAGDSESKPEASVEVPVETPVAEEVA